MESIRCFVFGALALAAVACKTSPKPEAAGGPTPSTSANVQEDTIKVGLIASLTGKFSALGSEDKKAVELAIEQANAKGGLAGKKITLLTRDDQTLPDKSVLAYNELKAADVVAVIGSAFSNSALATIPMADRDGVPYLSLTPAEEQVQPIKPFVFVIPALSNAYAERYLEYMQAQKLKKIAVAHDTKGAYAVAGYNATVALAPRYGVEIVKDEVFESATSDFSPIFTHLKGSGAQAFVFWGTGPSGVTVTKQYAAANLKIPLFMTPSQASKLWLEPVGAAGEGVSVLSAIGVVGDYLPDGPQKRVISEMSVPFQQKYGYSPPQFAQDGYSACLLLFEAIKKAGSAKRDPIRQELEHLTLLTPNGQYRYSPTDHSGLTRDFISVNVVSGGKLVPTPWAKEQLVRTVASQ
ncbi:MAG TPA: ABC transporter substrate-binding protein [Polyangiaceae bacterium]|jgi:branched-chain amino acid transport system substrate-binding protein|nr:ABC transporter substrate-binding protein [Polyangiaceae bacterium]